MEPKPSESDGAKTLARATKMVQLAAMRKHALNRTDVFSLLQDCFSPEASNALKILGYRLSYLAPSCMSTELWQFVLESAVKELAGASTQGSAPTLVHVIPVFDVLPTTTVLSFLQQGEAEPLKKIQACVGHESLLVRQVALGTFSRMTILCTKVLFARGLGRFPFESNEARIVAQQDVTSIINDMWKMNVHAAEAECPSVAACAFTSLAHLFERSLGIQEVTNLDLDLNPVREERGVDELISLVYHMAAPRFEFLRANAEKMPLEAQLDAMKYLAMLSYMMMQRSGGATPGLAIALVEVDTGSGHDDEKASTTKMRVDVMVGEMVDAWLLPAYGKASLVQAYTIAQVMYIIMAHPLQTFSRLKWSSLLVARLAAMTQAVSSAAIVSSVQDREHMLRLQIALLPSTNTYDCLQALQPTMASIAGIDASAHRQQFFADVWRAIVPRLCRNGQLPLLEALCASPLFHGCAFSSYMKCSRRASGTKSHASSPVQQTSYELFKALVESLLTSQDTLAAQWVVLKQFAPILSSKTPSELRHATLLLYTCLLTHACSLSRDAASVTFLHTFVEPLAFKGLPYPNVRVQLYWLCFKVLPPKTTSDIFLSWVTAELDHMEAHKDADAPPPTALSNDGLLGHPPTGRRPLATHDLSRFFALILSLKAVLAREPAFSQEVLQVLGRVRQRHATHRVICTKVDQAIQDVSGLPRNLDALPVCILPDLFRASAFFPHMSSTGLRRHHVPSSSSVGTVVSGPMDPLCLQISFREPSEAPELVALGITIVNASTVAVSNFSVLVGTNGPVRPMGTADSTLVRVTDELKQSASITSEKVFQFQHFARARFTFRVIYEGENPLRMGLSDAYAMPLEALLQRPSSRDAAPAAFQSHWQSAAANRVYNVTAPCTLAVHDLLDVHDKIERIDGLDLVTPEWAQFHFLTTTKWKEHVLLVLSAARDDAWRGTWEVRGPPLVVAELDKSPNELLRLLSSSVDVAAVPEKRPIATSPRHGKAKDPLSPTSAGGRDQVRDSTPTTTRRALLSFFGAKAQ
ncbi:hypothetical protein SPRG_00863 [Saprolegnia parasitica CBS 223.65]|uniref:AP-5 complex subunit beta-1 n=1 Tax=Saprolegnia parasitica (strain CBS 223.65) TaxID=695850 RepID=A0A067D724_SAPPC|nr:hypothetical protein SPRG_00863 [Saprolegnia parasitica CBS 223.65]KDO34802.1 hypothetical protein SPRG_00863 [Saprolegnia parasitica CBS 223.65]|eukprot:XP_012194469.1 hypothetical protein SPRG_00863 [Saprolegnia parasitica CBS 223.65]